jgi:hypothetical protein
VRLHAGLNHLFTATPTSYLLTLALGCGGHASASDQSARSWTVRVNGQDTIGTGAGDCSGTGETVSASGGFTAAAQQRYWSGAGVRLGRPARIDLVVAGSPSAGLTARVALYEEVPLADYPLPARPAQVRLDPDFGTSLKQPREVTLPGRAATGRWTTTTPYDDRLELDGTTTGPGVVEVRVNGQLVTGTTSWTYSDSGFQLPIDPDALASAHVRRPAAGQPVTVTVTVSRFAERTWRLRLGLGPTNGLRID